MYCNRIFDFMSWSLKQQVYFTVLYKSATPTFVKEIYWVFFCSFFAFEAKRTLGVQGVFC